MVEAKVLVPEIQARKGSGPKVVAVTAYDATMARLLDALRAKGAALRQAAAEVTLETQR